MGEFAAEEEHILSLKLPPKEQEHIMDTQACGTTT